MAATGRRRRGWRCSSRVYALGFGNHLSMVLLLPGYTLFLLVAAPRGWRSMFAPRVVALALGLALRRRAAVRVEPPRALALAAATRRPSSTRCRRFWFDVTKTDWRDDDGAARAGVDALRSRARCIWFDLRQQFGMAGRCCAPSVSPACSGRGWRRGVLMRGAVPRQRRSSPSATTSATRTSSTCRRTSCSRSLAAPAIVWIGELAGRCVARLTPGRATALAALVVAAYAGRGCIGTTRRSTGAGIIAAERRARAADGGARRSPRHPAGRSATGRSQNGLSYFTKETAPAIAYARMPDVLPLRAGARSRQPRDRATRSS